MYKRHETLSLLAGINFLNGQVHGNMVDQLRSREFVQYLKMLDPTYLKYITILIIMDNHSAHISKETSKYLATVPKRFDFAFTPTHGSFLNIIGSLFAKMTITFLHDIRVDSKDELKQNILKWIEELKKIFSCFSMEMEIRYDFIIISIAMLIRNRSISVNFQ